MLGFHTLRRSLRTGSAILGGLFVLTLLLSACAQQAKVYHVGILSGYDFFTNTADGFKAKMTDLGYIEGKNIVYDLQKTNFEPDKEQSILKKFVSDKVDLIVTFPSEVSAAAKAATKGTNIPVVFANSFIEGMDLVNSVREPGGNVTGVRYPGPDLGVKRLELLRQIAPNAKRFYVPYQQGYPIVGPDLDVLRPGAAEMGVTLVEMAATSPADIQADLDKRAKSADLGFDAILLIVDPIAVSPDAFAVIGKFATEHKIPVAGSYMAVGGYESIFGLATDNVAVGKQAAPLADKIFKGTPAGTIPVVSADSYLVVSPKAAEKIGYKVPDGILNMANQVIK